MVLRVRVRASLSLLFCLITLMVGCTASITSLAFSHGVHGLRCDTSRNDNMQGRTKATCNPPPQNDRIALGRRELLNAGVAFAAFPLAPRPAAAVDFESTLSIYGNDGDLPPSFLESLSGAVNPTKCAATFPVLTQRTRNFCEPAWS